MVLRKVHAMHDIRPIKGLRGGERTADELRLSAEQQLIFDAGITKLKPRTEMWRALANRPTAMQLDDATSKLLGHLDAIRHLVRSASDEARKDHKVSAALCKALADAAMAHDPDDAPEFAAEWLAQVEKMQAIATRVRKNVRSKRPTGRGPTHYGVHDRLIGVDIPALYSEVFGKSFPVTRNRRGRPPPGTKFVNCCLAQLGMSHVKDETIRTHVLNAKKRKATLGNVDGTGGRPRV
jgi:hypothetical protein